MGDERIAGRARGETHVGLLVVVHSEPFGARICEAQGPAALAACDGDVA